MKASISRCKLFKACRRAYFFRYVEEIDPIAKSEALETGSNYHELLEKLNNKEALPNEFSKERAMAEAYKKYIFPKFNVKSAEAWKERSVGRHTLIGRIDGIADDGCIVEHKSTSLEITEAYEYNLQWDEQILAYMYLTGARKVYYTVCRKPTIRQKQNESDEEFYERMIEWYDTDTDSKIKLLEIERTDKEVSDFAIDFFALCEEMSNTQNFYKCTNYCTAWGIRCEYSPICLNYDPNQDYVEFKKRERRY